MEIKGLEIYDVYIHERYSFIGENGDIINQEWFSHKEYDGGNLMLYIANELDKEDCIEVEFKDSYIRFTYDNYDTHETDYTTVEIERRVKE